MIFNVCLRCFVAISFKKFRIYYIVLSLNSRCLSYWIFVCLSKIVLSQLVFGFHFKFKARKLCLFFYFSASFTFNLQHFSFFAFSFLQLFFRPRSLFYFILKAFFIDPFLYFNYSFYEIYLKSNFLWAFEFSQQEI